MNLLSDFEHHKRDEEFDAAEDKRKSAKARITVYDPPSGWKYGFPKQYLPLQDESVEDTLIRDGYPKKDAKELGKWTRFWETNG